MKNIRLTLLAAAAMGVASIGGASAMPFSNLSAENFVQDVRVVCDQYGRCYNTRSNRRERQYDEPRRYNSGVYYDSPRYRYHDGPSVGVGIGPFGFRTW